jgi:hypothetical protein
MQIRQQIIKQAIAILGASDLVENSSHKLDSAEKMCAVFVRSAIEEVFLSILWKDAIKLLPKTEGRIGEFIVVPAIDSCVKVVAIAPSNIEWYIDNKQLYFKGRELSSGFYYSDEYLHAILNERIRDIPSIFITLCSLYLASNVAHSIYSNSVFTDGMKKQYLQKIEETRKLYYFDYHVINAGRVS